VSDEEALCDSLLVMVEGSKSRAEELLNKYNFDDEDDIQDLNEKMAKANSAYEEAQSLLDEENYGDAVDRLHQSLYWYGKVISEVHDEEEVEDKKTYTSALTAIELQEKIDRLIDKADSLELRAQHFSDDGIDVDEALNLIEQARNELTQAQDLLDTDVEEAMQLVIDAKKMLDDADNIIKDANKVNTVELAQRFVEKAELRAQRLEVQITHLMEEAHASPKAVEAVRTAFHRIYEHMSQIKGHIRSENIDDVLDEVEDNSDEVEETYQHIGKEEDKELLRDIQKLEAEVETINETLNKLSEQGIDTTNMYNVLKDVKLDLDDAKAALGTDNDTTRNLLEQVKNALDGIKDALYSHVKYGASHIGEHDGGHGHINNNKTKKGD
jgi:hypothetical protein